MSKGYLVIFALSSILSCVIANIRGEQQPKQPNDPIKQEYNLDLDWMRQLYHKSAVMALLKGKSKAILGKDGAIIPKYERTVYRLCEKDAKNPIALAKCLVTLMNARDENKRLSLENQNSQSFTFWDVIRSLNVPWEAWKAFIPGSKMFEEKEEYRRMKRTTSDQCQYVEPIANLQSSFVQEEIPQPKNSFNSPKQIAKKPHYSSNSKMKRIRMNFQDYPNSIHRFRTTPSIRAPTKRLEKYRHRFKRSLKAHEYVQNPNKFRASQDMKKYVDKFMKRINKENSKFLKQQGMNINYETQPSKNLNIIEDIFDLLNGYLRKANISEINGVNVLTPRIMPYFDRDPKDKEVRVLSPDILSFQKEGFLAWPTIIKLLTGKNNMAYDEWFEFVLEATGANQAMNKAIQLLKNDIVDMKENIYPHVLELEEMEKSWDKANSLHNCKQKSSLEKYGYAFLEPEQIKLSYNNKFTEPHQLNLTEYARMTPEDKELMLEDDIRKLAEWGHLYEQEQNNTKHRFKRASSPTMNSNLILTAATLSPSAFTTRINQGIILRHVTLSPNAFVVQVNVADILQIYTLSPQAFAVVVLNPAILFSRIISPVTFRAEILHPRILHAWVLSPTAFAVRVLSPRILQARVMSSLSMIVNILSPGIVHPRAGSPDGPMIGILSPQIFSPRVLSPNFVVINILNPPILSDPLDGL
uniref:Uncharacterized protein n=2 Tax=Acrobeloides nanus TaxID=290746 RepID=A0A914CK35_9BILA